MAYLFILIIYFILMFLVGIFFGKKNRSEGD